MSNVRLTNLRPNANVVSVGPIEFLFSYETCVAFRIIGEGGWVASENVWSQTTGKHLNLVSEKSQRIPREEFVAALDRVSDSVVADR